MELRNKMPSVTCDACMKPYSNRANLKKHWLRQPLCVKWMELHPGLKDYVDDVFEDEQNESNATIHLTSSKYEGEDNCQCKVCNVLFANVGNHNRHLNNSVMCKKWTMYSEMKPVSMYASFEAPKNKICHIIWNVFLIDKEQVVSDQFANLVRDEKIVHVVGIIKEKFLETLKEKCTFLPHSNLQDFTYTSLIYHGNTPVIDWEEYDKVCDMIEEKRGERKNVAVFCQNGYQRSLPLLVYYLIKTHREEVPTIERALDIILPQISKDNYVKMREEYIPILTDLIGSKIRIDADTDTVNSK